MIKVTIENAFVKIKKAYHGIDTAESGSSMDVSAENARFYMVHHPSIPGYTRFFSLPIMPVLIRQIGDTCELLHVMRYQAHAP